MMKLSDEILKFFYKQHYVIVSTIGEHGCSHSSCKGIVNIKANGFVHLLDLYKTNTFRNLTNNSCITITAVDEHTFTGYALQGKAKILEIQDEEHQMIAAWEKKLISRISHRVLKNMKGVKGHVDHPEASLPAPKYIILMRIESVTDLKPSHLRKKITNS